MHVVKNNNAIRGCRLGHLFSCHRTKGWQECIQGCRAGSFSQRGKAALGAGLAGPLLAGCGGGGQGGGPVTYWSNLEVGQNYFKQNIENPFEKSNQGAELKVTF
jgi:hypothetical protein